MNKANKPKLQIKTIENNSLNSPKQKKRQSEFKYIGKKQTINLTMNKANKKHLKK